MGDSGRNYPHGYIVTISISYNCVAIYNFHHHNIKFVGDIEHPYYYHIGDHNDNGRKSPFRPYYDMS